MLTETVERLHGHKFADKDFGSEALEHEHLEELRHHAEESWERKEAAEKTGFDAIQPHK